MKTLDIEDPVSRSFKVSFDLFKFENQVKINMNQKQQTFVLEKTVLKVFDVPLITIGDLHPQ